MGSCQNDCSTYCNKQEQEFAEFSTSTQNQVYNQEKSQKTRKSVNQDIIQLVRIQAWWRGQLARKKVGLIRSKKMGSNKYFNQAEARETISDKLYNPNQPRQKRPPYTFKSGAVYTGEWIGGFRDGFGQQVWSDGAQYIGYWVANKAHGKGKFIHHNGEVYEGNWANDKAYGRGQYRHASGGFYDGEWNNDFQNGFGIETWTDKSKYIGQYKNGTKFGIGHYQWIDQSYYKGEWVNNKISGYGVYFWLDERRYEGQWLENNMDGYGIYSWPDGRVYYGQSKQDKKQGFGIFVWQDGRRYEGYWNKGKQHGLGTYLIPKDGKLKFGLWEDGKRIEWFNDQQISAINNGQLDYTKFYTKQATQDKVIFQKPQFFDEKINEVKKKINLVLENLERFKENQIK